MSDEFYSLTMILDMEANALLAEGHNKQAFFVAACAILIAREDNA